MNIGSYVSPVPCVEKLGASLRQTKKILEVIPFVQRSPHKRHGEGLRVHSGGGTWRCNSYCPEHLQYAAQFGEDGCGNNGDDTAVVKTMCERRSPISALENRLASRVLISKQRVHRVHIRRCF